MRKKLTVGIDATNIRSGGGLTHISELLASIEPEKFGIERIVIWGSTSTLLTLKDHPWLTKCTPKWLDQNLLLRTLWQTYLLSKAARDEGCDVLFVPGGSYAGSFHPVVSMSQNLLPFEIGELRRYGWSMFTLKFLLLRLTQLRTFQYAEGVIFLTEYARNVVLGVTGKLRGQNCIIPHGLNSRFFYAPKVQRAIADYDDVRPYRVLYVSIIDQYKHQWHVVEAVAALRRQGLPIVLDLVGPDYPPALQRLNESIERFDADRNWVHYHRVIPFNELHHIYEQADLGLFASSCENLPNILMETMASGLPIACSNRGPMPEILRNAGRYFDPEQPVSIECALRELIDSPQLRSDLAKASFESSKQFSWQRCADETFKFIADMA